MIKELKKKMDKFNTVIAYFDHELQSISDMAVLNSMGVLSAYVDIHHIGSSFERSYGVNWIGYKQVPPAKRLIGGYLAQFRGDGLVVFVKPGTILKPNVEAVYDYAAHNRMERAYGFYVGPNDNPVAIGVAAPLLEHLFHAMPDSVMADADWIRWIHGWVLKTLLGGRYFDATALLTAKPEPDTPPPAEASKEPEKAPAEAPAVEAPEEAPVPVPPAPQKRPRGRPRKKA